MKIRTALATAALLLAPIQDLRAAQPATQPRRLPSPTKMLCLDNEADSAAWASRDAICALLDKARDANFNVIVASVNNRLDLALYERDTASRPLTLKDKPHPADDDPLRVVTEEARARGMRMLASLSLSAVGSTSRESVVYDRLARIVAGDTISTFACTVNDRGTAGFSVLTPAYGARVCRAASPACAADGISGKAASQWVSDDTTGPHALCFKWRQAVWPVRLELEFMRAFPMRTLEVFCDGTTVGVLRDNTAASISLMLENLCTSGTRTLDIIFRDTGSSRIARLDEVRVIEADSGRNVALEAVVSASSTTGRPAGVFALVDGDRITTRIPESAAPDAGLTMPLGGAVIVAEDPAAAALLDTVSADTPVTVTADIVLLPQSQHPCGTFVHCNSVHPEARRRGLALIAGILARYDVDGVILDPGRAEDVRTDFSDLSRQLFERDTGVRVTHWPQDIFTPANPITGEAMSTGPLFERWVLWRAQGTRSFYEQARAVVRRHPGRLFGDRTEACYAVSWVAGRNWAHEAFDPRDDFAGVPKGYHATGYAQMLDFLAPGVCFPVVRKTPGVTAIETVEGAIEQAQRVTAHRVKLVPAVCVANLNSDVAFEDALRACIQRASGVMVLSHTTLESLNRWDAARRGLEAVPIYLE